MPIGRETNDFYRTPAHVTRGLLTKETFGADVWEPACGDGAITRVLQDHGHAVRSSDLIYRGCGTVQDFLTKTRLLAPTIVTNPPFKLAEDFVLQALGLGAVHVAMLLRLAWLEGERRRIKVFRNHAPARVWVMSSRPTLWHGLDPHARATGGAISYAWFVWDRRAPPGTALGWIGRDDVREAEATALRDLCA